MIVNGVGGLILDYGIGGSPISGYDHGNFH